MLIHSFHRHVAPSSRLIYYNYNTDNLKYMYILRFIMYFTGIPRWLSGKESACQCRNYRFNPCIRKDPLEKEMATCSSIFAWEIPRTESMATVHGVVKSLSRLCTQAVYFIDHQMALVVQKTFVFDCNRILLNGTFFSLPRVILVSTSLNVFLFSQIAWK